MKMQEIVRTQGQDLAAKLLLGDAKILNTWLV